MKKMAYIRFIHSLLPELCFECLFCLRQHLGYKIEYMNQKKSLLSWSLHFILFFYFLMIFLFFHYSWFTAFCPFSTVQLHSMVTQSHTHGHILSLSCTSLSFSSVMWLWGHQYLVRLSQRFDKGHTAKRQNSEPPPSNSPSNSRDETQALHHVQKIFCVFLRRCFCAKYFSMSG